MSNTLHVVIVGAGFGGLGVAEQLAHVPVEVTLIDQHDYHTFQPLLYQVATSLLNAEDVGAPIRGLFRHQDNVTFHMATVTQVDMPGHKIQLERWQTRLLRLPGAGRGSDRQLFQHSRGRGACVSPLHSHECGQAPQPNFGTI